MQHVQLFISTNGCNVAEQCAEVNGQRSSLTCHRTTVQGTKKHLHIYRVFITELCFHPGHAQSQWQLNTGSTFRKSLLPLLGLLKTMTQNTTRQKT